jgi:hypothetical protein
LKGLDLGEIRPVKWIDFWPIFLLIIVYTLAYYNVDYVLIPTLFALGYTKFQVLMVAGSWGFLDMLGGFIAWWGFRDLMAKLSKSDPDFERKVKGELEPKGYIDGIKVNFCRKYVRIMDDKENPYRYPAKREGKLFIVFGEFYLMFDLMSDKLIRMVLRVLRGGSYFMAFLIGLAPVPGPRMASDIFCGTTRWKKGFIAVAVGNFIKTLCFVYGLWGSFFL